MARIVNPKADAKLDVKYPVLDSGFVSLIDYMGGDQRIAEAAWVSSIDEVEAEKKTPAAMRRIINYMMRERHTSPFEMVELLFRCKMPIFVARQWVRHRTASLNEMSGRYRILPMESYVPTLDRLQGKGKDNKQGSEGDLDEETKLEIQHRLTTQPEILYAAYRWYDQVGLANEIARLNLPLSQYTEWYWKIDLHNFLHFIGLRMHPHAQWEIQQYATQMYQLAWDVAPEAFKAYEEYRHFATTFSRTEMAVIHLLANGVPLADALSETNIKGKDLERFNKKLGLEAGKEAA